MKHKVIAYHLGSRIQLKVAKNLVLGDILKSEHSFILYKLMDDSFCYIKDYGSIVFIDTIEALRIEVIEQITNEKVELEKLACEKFILEETKKQEIHVGFENISIPEFTIDIAHMVMLNLGQSVALDYYYEMSLALLETTKVYAIELENRGSIKLSRKKMKKFIGKTMNLKNSIAENLFIFETSNLAWTDKDLTKLDNQMCNELEILNRHHGLQHNINVISENLDFFKDILQHKHSSLLEWIIIILILFEIIQVLVEKIL